MFDTLCVAPANAAALVRPTKGHLIPHDVAQRRVGLHGRGIHPDALALHQTRLGDQRQDPVKHRRVDFMGQARAGP